KGNTHKETYLLSRNLNCRPAWPRTFLRRRVVKRCPSIMPDLLRRPCLPAELTQSVSDRLWLACLTALFPICGTFGAGQVLDKAPGLIGYWKLQGDCRDYSGLGNHGVNHGVNLASGDFNGINAYIEVPGGPALKFGTGDFSLSAWIYTAQDLDDVVGDVLDLYDPSLRRGV